ncbi:DEAD/DEAH box helicase [Chryseomicrobium palamuruense]|uniref:DEAD/DEAH box helicase n=1 Tax=Chryseomicrobium palamuruense TaxID=682973 RepID=A0ABV8UWE3_9BACL
MNIGLKNFQDEATEDLLTQLSQAKREIKTNGTSQAVVLSSPTGSGKTVMTTATMESILNGTDLIPSERDAVFLWVSDSPELNEQSKKKVLNLSDRFRINDVNVITNSFDQEYFDSGKLYFINTQKLGKDKLLGNKGDHRTNTIWETINNTHAKLKDKFYLIIDEAHRGTNRTKADQTLSESIVQKFLLGDSLVGLDPISLVLGISATPDRFRKLIADTTGIHRRIQREVYISPTKVKDSGLLKDKIIIWHPDEGLSSDWSLLAESARKWKLMKEEWDRYSETQGIPYVSPAMIIQVEDRDDSNITKTDLEKVVKILEEEVGELNDDELAHCFEEDLSIQISNRKIDKIEASKIQEETHIKFVFFKMSLTTGWDCPRAEVMMSFRKAHDYTLISQLIGRMVRTPLAREIEGQELLNTVALYLPHYNSDATKEIITYLKNDDDSVAPEIEEGSGMTLLQPNPMYDQIIKVLNQIPTYEIESIRKTSNVRRLMKLSTLMSTIHGSENGFDENILKDSKNLIINTINEQKERLLEEDKLFAERMDYSDEITVIPVTVEQGDWKQLEGEPIKVELTSENISELFNRSGRRLGYGLHEEYWSKFSDSYDYDRAKVELFLTLQEEAVFNKLEKVCGKRVSELFSTNQNKINKLISSERVKYTRIKGQAKEPQIKQFETPAHIYVKISEDATPTEHHIFIDSEGNYACDFQSNWEKDTILEEYSRHDFVCWLRNYDRKNWSLRIPYMDNGKLRPMFPDFIVIRKVEEDFIVDILEPHNDSLQDNYKKAIGLANFAELHWSSFGRIELIRKDQNGLKRLDFTNDAVIQQIKSVTNNDHLNTIFDAYSTQ